MAMIDYGAMLRVNGKFINKNQGMFMQSSDTEYVCEKAIEKDGREIDVNGNYFVYAGDENFLIVFYKGCYKVISKGKVILSEWNMPFSSQTYLLDNLPALKISRLSTRFDVDKLESEGSWKNYVIENWVDANGDEPLSELEGGRREYKKFLKRAKRRFYFNKHNKGCKYRPFRFLAEWEYDGRKYEVIFGYGIEPNEDVWDKIKNGDNGYGFRKEEIEIIDNWFQKGEANE